jgi:hypothetical protein
VASQFCSHWEKNAVNTVSRAEFSGDGLVPRFGLIVFTGALLAGAGIAAVHAQAVLGDPRDAPRIFAANCSACHKSPRGLAKSGSVAGFLRQHYTTGPEMSAAMAAYLVAAGSAPEPKRGSAAADAAAAKGKSKKGEQLAAQPQGEHAEAIQQHTLRGKQRQAKAHEEAAAPPHTAPTASAAEQPAGEKKQTAALGTPEAAPAPAPGAAEPPVVLNVPMPELPEGPPTDLVESYFSSSPLP